MPWCEPVRWVGQSGSDDCSIAAMAMVAGVSLQTALQAAFPGYPYNLPSHYPQLDSHEMKSGLQRLNVCSILSERFGKAERRERVILTFTWRSGEAQGCGHTTVWCPVKQRFYDPGYFRPWSLRRNLYLKGFRQGVRTGDYLAVVIPHHRQSKSSLSKPA